MRHLEIRDEGPDVRGIVLCAGGSRRMGRPKGLLPLRGVPLLEAHVRAFADAGLAAVVVLGARVTEHLAVLPPGVSVILNPAWQRTEMSDSAWLALSAWPNALLTPVDVPPARTETLLRLLAEPGSAVPTFRGGEGHPVKLVGPHRPGLRLDERLRGAVRVEVDDPDILRNMNRWEDWLAYESARDAADSASRASKTS